MRARPIQREWALHRGVSRFVRKAMLYQSHIFMNWDRSAPQSQAQHLGEAARGALAGWPDTGLFWTGGMFLCELKWGKNKPSDEQEAIGAHLNKMGHSWNWAASVSEYGSQAVLAGVPLADNWHTIAQIEDEKVLADIRKMEERAQTAPASVPTHRRKRRKAAGISTADLVGLGKMK